MFIYSVKVDDAFPQPLLPDCAQRLFDSHVGPQQRLIDTTMSRDGVIEIGKPGRIGHALALHRPIVIGKNFGWMIFLPITYGAGDGHVARIGGFVVLCQFFGRAVGY
jgi:hypothetical protein